MALLFLRRSSLTANHALGVSTGVMISMIPTSAATKVGSWVLVLSYHYKETLLFTIDPYYGNLELKA